MEPLRRAAFQSVARGCGFASLAIACTVVGFSYEPVLAARSGGILTMLMTLVLLVRAHWAGRRDYRRTELWLILDEKDRPPAALAQWASATALHDAYLLFAHYAAGTAVVFWATAFFLSLIGFSASPRI